MKSIKLRFCLVIILAMTSLISVGFATWVATNEVVTTADGAVIVEDVLKTNNYITCSSEDITKFSYFDTGFVNNDGSISTTGYITSKVKINIDTCKVQFKDSDTLAIDLTLEQEILSTFNSTGNFEMTVEVTGSNFRLDDSYPGNKKCLTILYIDSFKDLSGYVEITIKYKFEIKNIDYYIETVLPELRKEEFNFIISARLSGAEVVKNG